MTSAKFSSSISAMKQSFQAIEDAKHHSVLLDVMPSRKTAPGPTKKIVITKAAPAPAAPIAQPSAVYEKMPQPRIAMPDAEPKKTVPKKKSKLAKLVRGRTVYDFSH
jgi:hypothetical protein